jgi:hypothetical protein
MAWFKVDDGFFSSRKVLMIPRAMRAKCLGIWVQAGTWSAKELTDGHVPGYVLDELGGIPEERDELIRVGLWLPDGEDGIYFHDWLDFQPSREETLVKRESVQKARSASGRAGGLKSAELRRSKSEANGKQNSSKTQANPNQNPTPDPTRPDPLSKDRESASRIPSNFALTEAMTLWATGKGLTIDVVRETEKFVDYWTAESGARASKRDWVAAWRGWMNRAQDYRPATADVDPWAGKKHLGFDA